MDTEWDKKVLRVVLGITRSRRELDELGIDSDSITSDRKAVFDYSELCEDAMKEAEAIMNSNLHKRLEKCTSELKQKEKLLTTKIDIGVTLRLMNFQKKLRV